MERIYSNVYRIMPSKVTPSKYVSFLLLRSKGNILFPCFGGHSSIASSFDAIDAVGGIESQLLSDMHFAARFNDDVYERFGAPVLCSEIEAPDILRKVRNVRVFPFRDHELMAGVRCVPTPGHRAGATAFLVQDEDCKILFIGDTIWHDGEKWMCLSSKRNRSVMESTLDTLMQIEFDAMISNTGVANPVSHVALTDTDRLAMLAQLKSNLS